MKLPPLPPAAVYVLAVCISLLQVARRWKCREGGTPLFCNRASAVQGQSVSTSSGLQEIRRAVSLLTRRDTVGKICWSHVQLLFPAHNWIGLTLMEVGVLFQLAGITLCNNLFFIVNQTRTFGQDDRQTFQPQPFLKPKIITLNSLRIWGKIQALELRPAPKA